jgi:hypothetical protein
MDVTLFVRLIVRNRRRVVAHQAPHVALLQKLRSTRVIVFLLALAIAMHADAQISAARSITIVARIPSSVTLTESTLPFVLEISQGRSTVAELAFQVRWNMNPSELQFFRVMAIARETVGLSEELDSGLAIREKGGEFRRFVYPNGQAVLLVRRVTQTNRMGIENAHVEIRIDDDSAAKLPDGRYHGMLYLKAEAL